MDAAAAAAAALLPSCTAVVVLFSYLAYLAAACALLPGRLVAGALLPDSSRLHYRCNGLMSLVLLLGLTALGVYMEWVSPTVVADKGIELLSATFIFSVLVAFILYVVGSRSHHQSSSLKPHVSGSFIQDWWLGVQLNPHFMGTDLKFFFVRAGMMAWLFINLSLFAKSYLAGAANLSVILYQFFSAVLNMTIPIFEHLLPITYTSILFLHAVWYVIDYFVHEEFMTSTWDIIAERLGFMLMFGDLVFIPFTFTIQGWWLLKNKVELSPLVAVANCFIFLVGYLIFRGANMQKHMFKKNPKASIWGKPPKVVGGKLLASGYWGIARHCNYLGDLLLALSFCLPCGFSSAIPYFYPTYLLILLIWRERRDEARCSQKYKEVWMEYCKLVPWRILPYVY